ncbi:thiamine phosphate synthase [Clostridium sp. BJN0001]|uniref:thiamine phosphate synthase n=1 Tax=Clostridium sp. BJN0001 TaxID=2930219 RepID=UPI0032AEED57
MLKLKFCKKSLQLYAITDRHWLNGMKLKDVVEEVLKSGATFLQLREKELNHDDFVAEAKEIKKLTDKYNVPFVINDDISVAKEVDADGVHIGQSDMEYTKAREILGNDKIIGVSAGNLEEAKIAEKKGADYIGIGAIFHTNTKKDACDMSKETLLEITRNVNIPIVAIGGITYDNCDYLKGIGVDGISVISAIFGAENPTEATKKLFKKTKEIFEY